VQGELCVRVEPAAVVPAVPLLGAERGDRVDREASAWVGTDLLILVALAGQPIVPAQHHPAGSARARGTEQDVVPAATRFAAAPQRCQAGVLLRQPPANLDRGSPPRPAQFPPGRHAAHMIRTRAPAAACAGIAGTRQRRIFMQRDAPITVPISRCEASSRTRA
jgi:hypothetical protein